jgi:transcriptional regulator with XRE-family HTH domain
MEPFKDQLVKRRESLGLSVAVAAARAGVEGPNYRAGEAGRRTPPSERQAVILAALEVPEDRAEYQRGALWALAAMHETLGRLYRELAQPAPSATAPPVSPSEAAEYEAMLSLADPANAPAAAAPSRARKRR